MANRRAKSHLTTSQCSGFAQDDVFAVFLGLLDLRKTPTAPDPSPAFVRQFSIVKVATATFPTIKLVSESLIDDSGCSTTLRKSNLGI